MRSVLLILMLLATLSSCDNFSKDDIKQLEAYGGLYIPSGEGPAAQMAPVDAVMLDSPKRALDDADFAEIFPVIRRMNPYRLHIRGDHTIGDEGAALLNQLEYLRVLDTSGTAMTLEGFKELKIGSLKQLYISSERFSEGDLEDLQKALSGVAVSRWRTDGPRHGDLIATPVTQPATTRASSQPALEAARKELEAVFAERVRATREKDAAALVAMISPDYEAILPDGRRVGYEEIIAYLRRGTEQFIEVKEMTITIEKLELRGAGGDEAVEAIVDARQRVARTQRLADGQVHDVFTTVLQAETWVRTPEGWKLRMVNDLREQQFLVDGQPVEQGR